MIYDNYELELVSSLMLSQATPDVNEVLDKIEPDMFSRATFREMYRTIRNLHSKGLEFDFISVSHKADIELENLTEMVKKSTGNASRVKYFAKKVRQGYYLRKAEEEFSQILDQIKNCSDESMIGEIAESVEEAVKNLIIETDGKKPKVASEILEQYMDIIDNRYNGGESERRIRVGIEAIDEKTQGFNQTDLIILAGCPGMGKTELMMSMVNGCSNEEEGALVFSMEMDEYQLIERAVSIQGNLPISAARNPRGMDQDDWQKFTVGMGQVKEKKFFVLDQAGLSVSEICARATEHKARYPKTNLICIDYVGLIPLQKAERHDIALGEVSRRLKQLAKELKTPVLLLAQVTSKTVESRPDKRPMASDIKDSSRLQDDADWIIFPYRDEVYHEDSPRKGIAEINFAKARHGTQGSVLMGWSNGHFININQEYAFNEISSKEAAIAEASKPKMGKKGF